MHRAAERGDLLGIEILSTVGLSGVDADMKNEDGYNASELFENRADMVPELRAAFEQLKRTCVRGVDEIAGLGAEEESLRGSGDERENDGCFVDALEHQIEN